MNCESLQTTAVLTDVIKCFQWKIELELGRGTQVLDCSIPKEYCSVLLSLHWCLFPSYLLPMQEEVITSSRLICPWDEIKSMPFWSLGNRRTFQHRILEDIKGSGQLALHFSKYHFVSETSVFLQQKKKSYADSTLLLFSCTFPCCQISYSLGFFSCLLDFTFFLIWLQQLMPTGEERRSC